MIEGQVNSEDQFFAEILYGNNSAESITPEKELENCLMALSFLIDTSSDKEELARELKVWQRQAILLTEIILKNNGQEVTSRSVLDSINWSIIWTMEKYCHGNTERSLNRLYSNEFSSMTIEQAIGAFKDERGRKLPNLPTWLVEKSE